VRTLFTRKGLPYPPKALFLRVFKEEDALELWARAAEEEPFVLVKEFRICARSGSLGPKRREGDLQVPEGFYVINMLNPNSTYHLSLGLSYPNASDRVLGERGSLGGAIFIHGSCVTIGCLPMTDEGIEEIYLSVLSARLAGQAEIPVHVFPTRLTEAALARLTEATRNNPGLARFWSGLKPGYDAFEKSRRVPRVTVAKDGSYRVSAGR
jgi:murein L,D-transpeptidase YafK